MHAMVPVSHLSFTDSAPFDCYWQCTECGFQISSELSKDPYREPSSAEPRDRRPEGPCQCCGERAWANLREGGVVEALIERDDERQSTRDARRNGVIKLACLAGWSVMVAMLAFGTDGVIIWPLAAGTTLLMLQGAYREYVSGQRAPYPNSWSHQQAPKGRVRTRHEGPVAADSLLRAPLSGRVCVAYELGVRHDSDPEAESWSWTLLEQRSAPGLTVKDVSSERPYLRLQREIHRGALSEAARKQLRMRGLDPSRPGYTLFESIVELGESLTLERHRAGDVLTMR